MSNRFALAARRVPRPAPIVAIACAWLAGTLALHALPRLPTPGAYVPLALVVLLSLRFGGARVVVVAGVAGFVWTALAARARLEDRLPSLEAGRDVALSGYVASFPTFAPGQATFSFAVDAPRPPGIPARVRLTWYEPPAALEAGDALDVVARLKPPHGARNPGGFDYERWLLVSGHGATGYVRSGAIVEGEPPGLARAWLALRARIAARIAGGIRDADAAALVIALAIGERYGFSEEQWADFRRTGTSHLVAVSGLHVGMIGVLVFALLRALCLRLPQPAASRDLEIAAVGGVLATAYYAALTGLAVPAQRSLLMIAIALALLVSRRAVGGFQVLGATLLAAVVWDPFAPLTASFWLSFVAVAVLLALAAPHAPLARARTSRVDRFVLAARELVRLQWSIGLALLPLTAVFFSEVSLVGPVVNLVAIPLFNLVLVPLTLLAALLVQVDALAATLAPPLLHALGWLAAETATGLHAVASAHYAEWPVPTAPGAAVALAALGVAFALPAHPLPGRRLAWLAVLPSFVAPHDAPAPGDARVIVLDVGQGLAVTVATHSHRLLFDAGPTFRSGFDSGDDIVLPVLAATGPRGLDRLIVSHADNDHAGGAAAVLAAYPDADVVAGPDVKGLGGRVCTSGERWTWDGVAFEILHPPPSFPVRGNESSCVLKVTGRGGSVLITGDVERRGEQALVSAGGLASDVVVVPHHGSATSSSAALVEAAHARYALVSAGYANRWGFPKEAVVERWTRSRAAVEVTSDLGALTVELGPGGPAVVGERERRVHYWQAPGPAMR